MLELGAYWGFYSLSLLKHCPNAICHLIEPCPVNLQSGKINFQRNGHRGRFKQAFVGSKDSRSWSTIPTISVDTYCDRNEIKHLHVLHSDIQGAEYEMLLGAESMLTKRMIDFLFISTHSNELHELCISMLRKKQYKILAHANLDDTYSFDGIIVARSPTISEPVDLTISLKRHASGRECVVEADVMRMMLETARKGAGRAHDDP